MTDRYALAQCIDDGKIPLIGCDNQVDGANAERPHLLDYCHPHSIRRR